MRRSIILSFMLISFGVFAPFAYAAITDGIPVARVIDNSTLALDGAFGVDTVVIGNNTYAVVASERDDGIEIIDITDPTSPNPVGRITDNSTLALDGARSVNTVVIGNNTYAIVAGSRDNGIEMIDITTPASPSSVARVIDNSTLALAGGFDVKHSCKLLAITHMQLLQVSRVMVLR